MGIFLLSSFFGGRAGKGLCCFEQSPEYIERFRDFTMANKCECAPLNHLSHASTAVYPLTYQAFVYST
jgi:hypothetical protein